MAAVDPPEQASPLERLAAFRFTYLSIFIFLAAYAFTMEGFEGLMSQQFQAAVLSAADVDPTDGPVVARIQEGIEEVLRESRWIRFGGVLGPHVGTVPLDLLAQTDG